MLSVHSKDHPTFEMFDSQLRSAVCHITNFRLSDGQWLQASLSVKDSVLSGVRRVASLAFPAFLASAASTLSFQASILTGCSGSIPDCHFLQAYLLDWSARFGTPPDQLPPKQTFWDRPVVASDRAPPQLILPCRVLAVWWRWQPLARRQNTLLCRVTMISSRSRSRPWVLSVSRPLLYDLGRRISLMSGEDREPQFLFQRISVSIQRFNAVLLDDSFLSSDHPD